MADKPRVLILCTENSARCQMAEGLLRHDAGDRFEVESAGVSPSAVCAEAVVVMQEVGIDMSQYSPKPIEHFDDQKVTYVLTVCDSARESCPLFFGEAKRRHQDFDDPAAFEGTEEERVVLFRRTRDELREYLAEFARTV